MQIGFLGLLTLIFVIAKLAGWLTWSWLWVFAPLWLGLVVMVAIFLVFALIVILTGVATK